MHGAAKVFLHYPAKSSAADGILLFSIYERFVCIWVLSCFPVVRLMNLATFVCNYAIHNCAVPCQVQEKYERLLSAAPTATLDCSRLFNGMKAIECIDNAVSKHAGRAFT